MKKFTNEKNALILLSHLKQAGIRYIIASPGNTNSAFIGSAQNDPYFKIISVVDERSAAYVAVGYCSKLNEPVVISCTGATASRNYMPALTEAFYRKLPILAVTSSQRLSRAGHLHAQFIDRTQVPKDVVKSSHVLPIVKDQDDYWHCEIESNRALAHVLCADKGPVHINLPTTFEKPFNTNSIPVAKYIKVIDCNKDYPCIKGKIAIFIGSISYLNDEVTKKIENFSKKYKAPVFVDHTSNYRGLNAINLSLLGAQDKINKSFYQPDVMIHIGEITGDYYTLNFGGRETWRVSLDGQIIDTFKSLKYVFKSSLIEFFSIYTTKSSNDNSGDYLNLVKEAVDNIHHSTPDLPFSNMSIAKYLCKELTGRWNVHLAILNSLRVWNFFQVSDYIKISSNVGGFGIDGPLSTAMGEASAMPEVPHLTVVGDLAFFYDINILGNKNIPNNMCIILINNGEGFEFKQFNHHAAMFGQSVESFISASGHNGQKSKSLIKGFAESLNFDYFSASDSDEFKAVFTTFVETHDQRKTIIECFVDSSCENEALKLISNISSDKGYIAKKAMKNIVKKVIQ
jgi:2-succinyl-5-enolpyruvyl-6-hydroxy-3-cyclohexene-1-carboxylate synthase